MVVSLTGTVKSDSSFLPSYDGVAIGIFWTDEGVSIVDDYTEVSPASFFSEVPHSSEKTWTLFKMKRRIVIECEGVKVWELHFRDLFDPNTVQFLQRSVKAWTKTVTNIAFNEDTTRAYRKACEFGIYNLIYIRLKLNTLI